MIDQISELSQLITALKTAERTCFIKNISRNASKRKPLYVQLFGLIEKSPELSDTELQKKLRLKSKPQFSLLKKHLLDELLDAIVFINKNETNNNFCDAATSSIKILTERKLFVTASKIIAHEKKESLEKQLLYKYCILLRLEYRLIQFTLQKNIRQKLDEQSEAIKAAADISYEFETIHAKFRKILHLRNHTNSRITNTELTECKLILKDLEKTQPTKNTPINEIIFETGKAILYYMIYRNSECNKVCNKILQLWQKNPIVIAAYPLIFKESATITFYNDFIEKKLDNFLRSIAAFGKLANYLTNEADKKHWVVISGHNMIKYFHKTGNYNSLKDFLEKEEKEISQNVLEVIPSNEGLSTITSLAISFFVLENFKKADEYLYTIKEMNKSIGRMDVHYFSLMFHLLIMFERKDWYRLHNATEAAYQQVYKTKDERPFEKELILFLGKLPKMRAAGNLQEQLSLFLQKLEAYKLDPVKKNYFLYFNYYGWLESKRDGIKYTDYVKQQIEENTI